MFQSQLETGTTSGGRSNGAHLNRSRVCSSFIISFLIKLIFINARSNLVKSLSLTESQAHDYFFY